MSTEQPADGPSEDPLPPNVSSSDGDRLRARALVLELRELIQEMIDARRWAIGGLEAQLAEETAGVAETRRTFLMASSERAWAHWNATTLIMIYGGIEDLVETMGSELAPLVNEYVPRQRQNLASRNRMRNRQLRAAGSISALGAHALTCFTKDLSEALFPHPKVGPNRQLPCCDRWEAWLSDLQLRPIPGRPIPDKLRRTLNEFGEVRNVLLQRMGRMDGKALSQVSEGPWAAEDELVVIDQPLYRRYVAALIAYERELEDRIRWRVGVGPQWDLTAWREMVPLGR